MTAAENVRLSDELERLRGERERMMDGVGADADVPADAADQSQRVEMRAEVERMDVRILEIGDAMEADSTPPADGTVGDGTLVGLRFDDGDMTVVRLGGVRVGVDDTTVVTAGSPVGRALIGRREGETVTYDAPAGARRVTIETVGPVE